MVESDKVLLNEYRNLGTPDQFRTALNLVDAVSNLLKRIETYRKPEPPLLKEFNYYLQNQNNLLPIYNGRVIVIKDCRVIGAYDDDLEAITETSKCHELGTFLVQKVSPGDTDIRITLSNPCYSISGV